MKAGLSQSALRGRLLRTYIAVLLAGLLAFAIVAVFAIDRAVRSSLDSSLATAAQASAAFVDVEKGHVVVDADAQRQFLNSLDVQLNGAIFDRDGRVELTNVAHTPVAVARLVRGEGTRFATVGRGDKVLRVFVLKVMRAGVGYGSVAVWRSSDWVNELDRGAAAAFVVATLVISGLAVLLGNAVTRRALEDAFARQRRFTADASHELRAPLAVVRAEADLALRKEREGAEYRTALTAIAQEADRIESLLDHLLAAARAEGGGLDTQRVDVSEICTGVGRRLESAARAKGIDLEMDIQPDLQVAADGPALNQVFLALIHNAIKFTPEGGRVRVALRRAGERVELLVRDSGPGFSPEALAHGFERFWRDDRLAAGGTGLGLAVAKATLEALGGCVAISNDPQGGALVRCELASL
ncbi:MAG: HAMP domain-containing histidine kinase [Candidatus Eremiobacteraeota bacterium]|nr:HAMP domain-containing histidine kinase [Candidatus Eremiobacteraeota bacterium]